MVTWTVLEASVRGSSHEQRGTPNQDAVATRVLADGRAVVALSDGHGGERYVRSDAGSRFAVDIACEVLSAWSLRTAKGAPLERELRDEIVPAITREWLTRVEAHLGAHPFTDEERARTPASLDALPIVAYGATLLVAVASDGALALAQLGDGDIVLVRGDDIVLPIAPDARLVASQTTSLCLESADADFRCAVVNDVAGLDLVLLSTDGYANSFADDDWERSVGVDLAQRLADLGPDAVRLQLPAWLGESAAASGDDTSVALLVPNAVSGAVAAGAARTGSGGRSNHLRRLLVFSASALAIGLVGGWFWGNAAADSSPSRSLPPAIVTTGSSLGGTPVPARATIVAGLGAVVAFDPNPRTPAAVRRPTPGVGAVTRVLTGDDAWEVTADGDLTYTPVGGVPTPVPLGIKVSAITAAGPAIWAVDANGTALVPVDIATHTPFPVVLVPAQSPDQSPDPSPNPSTSPSSVVESTEVPSTSANGG